MKDFKALAIKFYNEVSKRGFTFQISESGSIISVRKYFPKGDLDAFVTCDMTGPYLLSLVPTTDSNVWGTDGGGVGGYIAVQNGNYCLNKSTVQKRFVKELKKLN